MSKAKIGFILMAILVLTNVGWGFLVYEMYQQNQELQMELNDTKQKLEELAQGLQ